MSASLFTTLVEMAWEAMQGVNIDERKVIMEFINKVVCSKQ